MSRAMRVSVAIWLPRVSAPPGGIMVRAIPHEEVQRAQDVVDRWRCGRRRAAMVHGVTVAYAVPGSGARLAGEVAGHGP